MCDDIRIYVADLAAYNNGRLHGVWINALDDPGDIRDQINAMLVGSPEGFAEEFAIHDYEGFDGYDLGEYESIDSVHEIACFIDDHPEMGGALLNHFGGYLDEARTAIDDHYCGEYESLAEYAQQLTEETTEIPESLVYYIDYERMGRDMGMSGDIFTIDSSGGNLHIFWSH